MTDRSEDHSQSLTNRTSLVRLFFTSAFILHSSTCCADSCGTRDIQLVRLVVFCAASTPRVLIRATTAAVRQDDRKCRILLDQTRRKEAKTATRQVNAVHHESPQHSYILYVCHSIRKIGISSFSIGLPASAPLLPCEAIWWTIHRSCLCRSMNAADVLENSRSCDGMSAVAEAGPLIEELRAALPQKSPTRMARMGRSRRAPQVECSPENFRPITGRMSIFTDLGTFESLEACLHNVYVRIRSC